MGEKAHLTVRRIESALSKGGGRCPQIREVGREKGKDCLGIGRTRKKGFKFAMSVVQGGECSGLWSHREEEKKT